MDDHFDIRTLPSVFVSKSRPSKVIEKLNDKRKNAHNKALEDMTNKRKEVNTKIQEKISNNSEDLKKNLSDSKKKIEGYLFIIRNKDKAEFSNENCFQEIHKYITDGNKVRTNHVDDFYDRLVNLEKQRSTIFKEILKEAYTKMLNISYKLPFEIEEFFEKEIVEINKITLINFQNYAELQTELNLQIENDLKLWIQELFEIKENVKIYLKEMAQKSAVISKCKLLEDIKERESVELLKEMCEINSLRSELEIKITCESSMPVSVKDVEEWLKDVRITLAFLDQRAKNIVKLYKSGIIILFNRFFTELDDIKRSLMESEVMEKSDIEEFQFEIYTPTVEELNIQFDEKFKKLQTVWGDVISYMEKNVEETYEFLKNSAYLWDDHFDRIEEVQHIVMKDLKNAIMNDNLSEEDFESKLNILIEKLRQGATSQKLEKIFNDAQKVLDDVEKTYRSNSVKESNVLEKYKVFVEMEVDVLMSEIKRFLTMYPPDQELDPKKQRKRASQTSEVLVDPNDDLIPMQMHFCRYQVDAIKNWHFGLWEAVKSYMSTGRTEIVTRAEEWIKTRCQELQDRLSVKLAFHKPRHQRIKSFVYEKRLQELQIHSSKFTSHKNAAENGIKKLKTDQKLNDAKYNEAIQELNSKSNELCEQMKNTENSYQAKRFIFKLRNFQQDISYTFDNITSNVEELCVKFLEDIKVSNYKFTSAVKLFSEDGNFSTEEAKNLLKNLNKVRKNVEKGLDSIRKEEKGRYTKYKQLLDKENGRISTWVDQLLSEHEFKEKTANIIKSTQKDMNKEGDNVKTVIKKTNTSFIDLMTETKQKLGESEFVERFVDQLQEITTQIKDLRHVLIHPLPIVMYSAAGITEPATVSKHSIKHVKSLVEKFDLTQQPDSLLTNLKTMLHDNHQDIHVAAKNFYAKHHVLLLDQSIIEPDIDSFMLEVEKKIRYLLAQCEVNWIECVSDYLNFVIDFMNFKEHSVLEFRNEFCNLSNKFRETVMKDISKQLRNERSELQDQHRKIQGQLKALHGHPNNRDLLQLIELEFMEFGNQNDEKFGQMTQSLKDVLLEEYDKIRHNFEETKQTLENLPENDGLFDLQDELKDQLITKINQMKELVPYRLESELSENNDVQSSVSDQILAYLKDVLPQPQSKLDVSCCTLSTGEDPFTAFLDELDENFERDAEKIGDFVSNDLVGLNDKMKIIWTREITSLIDLYKVQYDKDLVI